MSNTYVEVIYVGGLFFVVVIIVFIISMINKSKNEVNKSDESRYDNWNSNSNRQNYYKQNNYRSKSNYNGQSGYSNQNSSSSQNGFIGQNGKSTPHVGAPGWDNVSMSDLMDKSDNASEPAASGTDQKDEKGSEPGYKAHYESNTEPQYGSSYENDQVTETASPSNPDTQRLETGSDVYSLVEPESDANNMPVMQADAYGEELQTRESTYPVTDSDASEYLFPESDAFKFSDIIMDSEVKVDTIMPSFDSKDETDS